MPGPCPYSFSQRPAPTRPGSLGGRRRRRGRPPVTGTALVVALVAVLTLFTAGAATAHDVLVSTDPADGARVPTAPARIRLTFDEPALAVGSRGQVTG
ncbi:MAG TPA: copper resistance protein CopC, partial [Kineosporiaceae bacterium]